MEIETINQGLNDIGRPVLNSDDGTIRIEETLPSGRARTIRYESVEGPVTMEADDFRVAVEPNSIKSTWFERIERNRKSIAFEGRGWGHGVGMSQWGARVMASRGRSYEQILRFYFEPTHITGQYGPTFVSRERSPSR